MAMKSRTRSLLYRTGMGVAGALLGLGGMLALVLYLTFSGVVALSDGERVGPSVAVVDGTVASHLIELGDGRVALVDCGSAKDAQPILSALRKLGYERKDVVALFLTHGHGDHRGGIQIFSNATVYAHREELPLLEGKVRARGPLPFWV
jgi:glyoxylase-like metal-dependent hydrolase (beta-lactamase superfamily II)